LNNKIEGEFPYDGIIRIRFMGLFSASSNEQAPLNYHFDNHCKITIFIRYSQEKTQQSFVVSAESFVRRIIYT